MARRKRLFVLRIYKRKLLSVLVLIAFLITATVLYLQFLVNPVIYRTTNSKVKMLANKSMNIAVTTAMNQGISYGDLIKIETNDGKTTLLQANSIRINALAKLITRTVQENLRDLLDDNVKIHIGAFSGLPILTNIGPSVSISLENSFGDISCKFSSDFVSSGINQTQHKIYLHITTRVNIVFATQTMKVESGTDVLLCESIIIGEIPSTYLRSDSLDEMMNLIPL